MAQERSDKCRWFSKYAQAWISDSQKLAEFICERMAAGKKLSLPQKFWFDPSWGKIHKTQLVLASKLLKKFPCELILEVLGSASGNTWSLAAPWLSQLLEQKVAARAIQEEKLLKKFQAADPGAGPAFSPLFDFSDSSLEVERKKELINRFELVKSLESPNGQESPSKSKPKPKPD